MAVEMSIILRPKLAHPKLWPAFFFTLTNLFNELLNQCLAPFQEALWFYLLNHLMASLSNKCTRGNAALLLGSVYRYSYCFVAWGDMSWFKFHIKLVVARYKKSLVRWFDLCCSRKWIGGTLIYIWLSYIK